MKIAYLAIPLFLLTACGAGSGGGDDNRHRSDAVTGPSTSVVVTCATTADRNVGDTTVNVDVNCPSDSGNTTTTKTP